jgi:hypothetical protein
MKDGDKAKAAKAKTSGKKVSSKAAAKEKGGKVVKAAGSKKESSPAKGQAAQKSSSGASSLKAGAKAVSSPKSNGKAPRPDAEAVTFTNPAIESAFKRAVKKYPNTFRRLTD